jgi:hypothetical protein
MILFLLLIVVILAASINSGMRLAEEQKKLTQDPAASVVTEDVPKFCPPHKWFHQEVKDLEGNTVKWRLVCSLCGPLKPSSGPARME